MSRAARAGLLAAALLLPHRATAAPPAAAAAAPSRAALEAALGALGGADLVVVAPAGGSGGLPSVLVALRARVPPERIQAVLRDPARYPDAVPALERVEVTGRGQVPGTAIPTIDLEWELEIPLFNLVGQARMIPQAGRADLTLVGGDLSPGKLTFSWSPAAASPSSAPETILTLEAQVNVRASGWLFRRIVSRSPFGDSAMNATAAWVVLRAIAELAEHPGDPRARRPQAAPAPPPLDALDGTALAGPALAPFRARGVVGAIRRAPSGRLLVASFAVPVAMPPAALAARLAAPDSWRAFPGWHEVKPLPAGTVEVNDNLPFVDLDATWSPSGRLPTRVVAIDGAARGARFGWDVVPAPDPAGGGAAGTSSLAILSMYPRLEATGYVPRRFIEAEPLLEHGMALALAFADAMSVKASLEPRR